MPQEKKEAMISKIEELFSGCTIAMVTDYRGLSVAEMTQLRRRLRESGIRYQVVKNRLASFAAERAGKERLRSLLQGPSAIVVGYGDIAQPAKILVEYIRSSKIRLSIRGGLMDGQLLSPEEIVSLSLLPSKEVLLSRLMQEIQAPIRALLTVLTANLREIITLLQARKRQLEGEGEND